MIKQKIIEEIKEEVIPVQTDAVQPKKKTKRHSSTLNM